MYMYKMQTGIAGRETITTTKPELKGIVQSDTAFQKYLRC